ncbi:FtsK/SpoIIIE domain-containing protein [Arthrobacter sp. A5]|uniref:FtsK/SpoIIIE domain-containing protein n=1 Tax=Arthrobacter sp. A5 TaxID=576926 RepID=UPI003DA9282F
MRLELTVVSAPGAAPGDPVELSADVPFGAGGSVLALDFAGRWPNTVFSLSGQPLSALVAGTPPLVNGAVLVARPAGAPGSPKESIRRKGPALVLAVLTGPDAGAVFALRRGRYRIGRGRVEICVQDPGLSRVHAELEVGERVITLRPAVPTGHYLVDGAAPRWPAITVGRVISFGSTSLMLTFLPIPNVPATGTECGPLVICHPHGGLRGKGTLLATSALPLMLGTGLALLTGQWMFMAFAAMSAVTALVPLFGVRHRRRLRQELASALRLDSRRRKAGAPSAASLVLRGLTPPGPLFPDDASLPRSRGFPANGRGDGSPSSCGSDGSQMGAAAGAGPVPEIRSGTGGGGSRIGDSRIECDVETFAALAVHLRVGTADQPANIVTDPPDAHFTPPLLPVMPVVVALGVAPGGQSGGLSCRIPSGSGASVLRELNISGPREAIAGLVRFLLMQLDSAGIRTVVAGPADTLPLAARFLPHVSITADAGTLGAQLDRPGPVVVIQTDALPGLAGSRILPARKYNSPRGVYVIRCHPAATVTQAAPGAEKTDGAEPATGQGEETDATGTAGVGWIRLGTAGDGPHGLLGSTAFEPDLVSAGTFDRYARRRAAVAGACAADLLPETSDNVVPTECPLIGLVGISAESVLHNWSRHGPAALAEIAIGVAADGPLLLDLDLERDGPHLLVAGTTGSGKSELLRTLVASLALSHPPTVLSLLFLDFKGGSGLGPLADLPHCTGLVTDISGHGLNRVLTSLRAETRRREGVFGRAAADDIRSYASSTAEGLPPVPHLVIVIDEFRMLVEQAPDAMSELMRIAVTGRSLGIHLVMATQRPQGAISADIRANVTTSVCLRVQSGYESLDVINSPLAGAIPLTLPGRAYISRGGSPPIEFQTAALGTRQPPTVGPRIRPARLAAQEPPAVRGSAGPAAMAAALELTRLLAAAQALTGQTLPAAPLAPELPALLSLEQLPRSAPGQIPLGLLDLPEQQYVAPLTWDPVQQSHLALIGPAAGARTAICSLAIGQLLRCRHLDPWLYCLDGDGSLAALAPCAAVGSPTALVGNTAVGSYLEPVDLRSAARLLQLLAGAADAPRSATTAAENVPAPLILAVTGWGRWLSAIRSGPWPWCEDLLADIVRDGPGSGVTVIISGERELVTARFMAGIPNRVFLPMGASAESMLAWPRLPAVPACSGRALVMGKIADDVAGPGSATGSHAAQLALPGVTADGDAPFGVRPELPKVPQPHDNPVRDDSLRVDSLRDDSIGAGSKLASPPRGNAPFRVQALPKEVLVDDVRAAVHLAKAGEPDSGSLLLGLGGDNLDPVFVRLEPGSVLLAIGPPRSGKTTLLDALPALNPGGFDWVCPPREFRTAGVSERDYLPAAAESRRNGRVLALLLDDVETLSEASQAAIYQLLGVGAVVIATTDSGQSAQGRFPLAVQARCHGQGLVLAPRRPSDGDFFNCRIDAHGQTPPGRAVLLDRGSMNWLQLPGLHDPRFKNSGDRT